LTLWSFSRPLLPTKRITWLNLGLQHFAGRPLARISRELAGWAGNMDCMDIMDCMDEGRTRGIVQNHGDFMQWTEAESVGLCRTWIHGRFGNFVKTLREASLHLKSSITGFINRDSLSVVHDQSAAKQPLNNTGAKRHIFKFIIPRSRSSSLKNSSLISIMHPLLPGGPGNYPSP